MTSSRRRWPARRSSSSACWRRTRSALSALTRAWAAWPAKIDRVASWSAAEPVAAELGQHDQALDAIVVGRPARSASTRGPWSAPTACPGRPTRRRTRRRAWLCAATQPVSPSPIRTRSMSGRTSGMPMNAPLEGDRLADAALVVDPVDADVVEVDQLAGRRDDRLADRRHVGQPAEPAAEVLDRLEPGGELAGLGPQPGVGDGRGDLVGERPGQLELLVRPGPVGSSGRGPARRAASSRKTIGTKHDGPDPVAQLGRPDRRASAPSAGIAAGPRSAARGRSGPGRRRREGGPAGRLAQARAQAAMGGQAERAGGGRARRATGRHGRPRTGPADASMTSVRIVSRFGRPETSPAIRRSASPRPRRSGRPAVRGPLLDPGQALPTARAGAALSRGRADVRRRATKRLDVPAPDPAVAAAIDPDAREAAAGSTTTERCCGGHRQAGPLRRS